MIQRRFRLRRGRRFPPCRARPTKYYLRGFNLDHGSDFATTLAGVPMNESSGAHAHGYSDVNLLIPELVSGVQYTKGPYFAEHGDFSAAGSADISYVNVLDRPQLSLSGGGQGWSRVFGAASPRVGRGHVLTALELSTNDGPWERPDDMRKVNAVDQTTVGLFGQTEIAWTRVFRTTLGVRGDFYRLRSTRCGTSTAAPARRGWSAPRSRRCWDRGGEPSST